MYKVLRVLALTGGVVGLTGCAAIGTAVSHGSLETNTLMSKSIFMNPVQEEKTIYVQVRNTTDKPGFKIGPGIQSRLASKGYCIVNTMDKANYVLQVNVLQMGKTSKTAAKEMLGLGFGGALEGAASGAVIAGVAGGDVLMGGLAGSVATTIADNAVKDVTYSGIVDIRVMQRKPNHKGWVTYRTRILTMADKVNLKFAQAQPVIEKGLENSISGLF